MDSDYQTVIDQVSFLATLPRADAEALLDSLEMLSLPAGHVFLHEGDMGCELYIVVSGEVEIVKALGTRAERQLAVHSAGVTIGEMSLLNPDQPRSATARTLTPAKILVLTRGDFERLLARHPAFSLDMLRSLSSRLRYSNEITIQDLRRKNRELDKAYADLQAAQQKIIEQEVLAAELRSAGRIQQHMLPHTLPQVPGIELGAVMIPARQVGGDFYDVIPLEGERLAVVVGDVAGKGIPAALYMAQVCTLIRAAARRITDPEAVLRTVNEELEERELDGMFVTVLYGELNLAAQEFTYVRAGHDHPLIWNERGELIQPAEGKGVSLGLLPAPPLDVQTLSLTCGDTLLITTDGVTEAMDDADIMFGRAKLAEVAVACPDLAPQVLCETIVDNVRRHQGDVPQSDDITLLALRCAR